MKINRAVLAWGLSGCWAASGALAQLILPALTDGFEAPPQGWSVYGRGGGATWSVTGGEFGGCLTSQGDGNPVWGFEFNGDGAVTAPYFSWYVLADRVDTGRPDGPDIDLEGPAGHIVSGRWAPVPGQWTRRFMNFGISNQWRVGSLDGPVASEELVDRVRHHVTRARFRVGYAESGTGFGAIDSLLNSDCGEFSYFYDYNNDGDNGTDQDIEDFFRCLGGNCCATCRTVDVDGDHDVGTDADIEAFFRVLAGACP